MGATLLPSQVLSNFCYKFTRRQYHYDAVMLIHLEVKQGENSANSSTISMIRKLFHKCTVHSCQFKMGASGGGTCNVIMTFREQQVDYKSLTKTNLSFSKFNWIHTQYRIYSINSTYMRL